MVTTPDPAAGLDLYRELAAFVAAYLPHIHLEETVVMARIWEDCGDDDIARARLAFMADTPPEVTATTVELLLPAPPARTRAALIRGRAATPAAAR